MFKPERISGHRVQKMRIVWNCIGEFICNHVKTKKRHSRISPNYADFSGIMKSLSCTTFRRS
uniref:hypothetical protein n=1 Tax=Ndongobacter massiliensis TaxID=1871025 RepID=UPI001E594CB3|nr:hypothetical protein [Ndongobacter massiliensis]